MLSRISVAAIGLVLLANGMAAQEKNMVKLHVDTFTVAGVSVRTSNAKEMTSEAPIGKLWQRLASDNFLARIPNKVDDSVIALYTDYENGKDGLYTYLLGAKVSSKKDLPAEFVARDIVSGEYGVFTAKGGAPGEMTVNLWKQIWSLEKPGGLERAYKTDYEVHYGEAENVQTSRTDIYIGLKDKK